MRNTTTSMISNWPVIALIVDETLRKYSSIAGKGDTCISQTVSVLLLYQEIFNMSYTVHCTVQYEYLQLPLFENNVLYSSSLCTLFNWHETNSISVCPYLSPIMLKVWNLQSDYWIELNSPFSFNLKLRLINITRSVLYCKRQLRVYPLQNFWKLYF